MSSNEPQNAEKDARERQTSGTWKRLALVISTCLVCGALVSLALPWLLSVVEWPKLVSPAWVERMRHPPNPTLEPPPDVEPSVVQPVSTPTPPTPEPAPDVKPRPSEQSSEEQVESDKREAREAEPAAPDEQPTRRPARPDENEPEDSPTDVTYNVDRRAIAGLIRSPSDLGKHGHFVPNTVDGQRRGFRFIDVAAGGLFDRLGVRAGDVVLEVNGRRLTTQAKLLEDLPSLQKAHVYVVHIERGDARRIHRYDAGPPLERKPADTTRMNNDEHSQ